ncbi:MAG: 50S ribosomal protein L25/general stress protein Ctc [Betaproteobacteria bacterium]|nr:50S ribosomal protein L25/general stress protein Ctc [Betaproteobacteria bacterium]
MQFEFTAYARSLQGTGASRRLRRAGKTPGIVYGGAAAPQNIEIDHNALYHALKNEAFHASILTMKLEGKAERVLLRDVQMHPYRLEVQHIDFQRVDENQKIHMRVPLHFVKEDVSPAVKQSGAVVSHILTELDVSCLPKDLPEFISVDLSELTLGQPLHVRQLKLPDGVSAVTHRNEDPVVVSANLPRAAVETEAAAEAAPAAAAPAEAAKPAKPAKPAKG